MRFRIVSRILICWIAGICYANGIGAQTPTQPSVTQPAAAPAQGQKWYYRDPRTGKLFQRELRGVQQTVQQIVQTEVPEPAVMRPSKSAVAPLHAAPTYTLAPGQPLIRIPILAQQQLFRWPQPVTIRPIGQPSAVRTSLFQGVLPNSSQTAYSAPMSLNAPVSHAALRDSLQLGMPVTVLR